MDSAKRERAAQAAFELFSDVQSRAEPRAHSQQPGHMAPGYVSWEDLKEVSKDKWRAIVDVVESTLR